MIGFVGLTHLGLVSSIAAASKGYEVVAYDPNEELCSQLSQHILPISEPGLEDQLEDNPGEISFTSDSHDLSSCQIVYISLDVPTNDDGTSDLQAIRLLCQNVIYSLAANSSLVVLSQVPPGFNRELYDQFRGVLAKQNISLFHQVETLIFGQALERATNPERIIIGCYDPLISLPSAYASFLDSFDCPLFVMRYESAELAKASINMFLVSSVTATNTLAEICENVGADWREIAPALKADRRIGQYAYLVPGLGLSGGNLERDMATLNNLSAQHDTHSKVIDAYLDNSIYRQAWVHRILSAKLVFNDVNARLAIWGLSYKPDTDSTRNSPAIALIESLKGLKMQVYDPQAILDDNTASLVKQYGNPISACCDADALAIMTPWREFSDISLENVLTSMKGRLIVDPFGVLDNSACRIAGLEQHQLGVSVTDQI